jgi:hypothetical protein
MTFFWSDLHSVQVVIYCAVIAGAMLLCIYSYHLRDIFSEFFCLGVNLLLHHTLRHNNSRFVCENNDNFEIFGFQA